MFQHIAHHLFHLSGPPRHFRAGGDSEVLNLLLVRLSFDDAASAELLLHVGSHTPRGKFGGGHSMWALFFQWDRCLRLMSKWNMILLVYFSTYNSEAFNAFHIICCCIFVAQASQVVGWISLCLSWLWSQGVARRGARCGVPWLQLGLAGVTGQHRVGVSCM